MVVSTEQQVDKDVVVIYRYILFVLVFILSRVCGGLSLPACMSVQGFLDEGNPECVGIGSADSFLEAIQMTSL